MNHPVCSGAQQAVPAIFGIIMILVILAIVAAMAIFMVFLWWRIFSKAGYSWALGLLMFIPIANLVMFLVLAFSDWPIMKELRALKQSSGNTG